MSHGSQCTCMMCGIGKKVGLLKDHEENGQKNVCPDCSHSHGEDGKCNCGCESN